MHNYRRRGNFSGAIRSPDPGTGTDESLSLGAWNDRRLYGKHERVLDTGMECSGGTLQDEAGESVLHQAAAREEERRKGRGVDSDMPEEGSDQGELCTGEHCPATATVQQDDLRP